MRTQVNRTFQDNSSKPEYVYQSEPKKIMLVNSYWEGSNHSTGRHKKLPVGKERSLEERLLGGMTKTQKNKALNYALNDLCSTALNTKQSSQISASHQSKT